MKRVAWFLFLTSIAFGLRAQPDPDRMRALESKLEELQKRLDALSGAADADVRRALDELRGQIDALTREIETLKSGVPEKAATEGRPEVPGLGPAASRVYRSEHGVSIGGYGEALYQNFDRRRDDGAPSGESDRLDLLRAVFYFGYKFDDRFLFNSEIEYEHASTGEGSEEKGEVSVEFAYLDYLLGKKRSTGLRAGLVLIPVGFINELHEPPIFLGARRPELERRILPATWSEVGIGAFGQAGPVAWRGYVVNGLDASGFSAGCARGEGAGRTPSRRISPSPAASITWVFPARWRESRVIRGAPGRGAGSTGAGSAAGSRCSTSTPSGAGAASRRARSSPARRSATRTGSTS